MHRENDSDVINARKALEKICENNANFKLDIDSDSITVTNVSPYSGDSGVAFLYSSNGMQMSVAISDKKNQIVITSQIEEKNEWFWYYQEYKRLHKLVQTTLSQTKNKTK